MEVVASRYRTLTGGWRLLSIILPAVSLVLVLIYVFHVRLFGIVLTDLTFLYLLIAIFLPMVFLWLPMGKKSPRDSVPWYDVLFGLVIMVVTLYYVSQERNIRLEAWGVRAPLLAQVFGFALWLLVIEAGRRATGSIFAAIVIFFSFYPMFARYLPSILMAPPFTFSQVISYHALSEESIVGIPMHIFGSLILGYMFFAIALQAAGAGDFFTDLAIALLRNTRVGTAKVAILSSALFGTISGSGVANVYVTGSFTIPAMKKEGLSAEFAGAVEASVDCGSMITPPIMGAAAFIMAEFINVSYATICIAAAVPAALFYVCLYSQLDMYAARLGFKPKPIEVEVPPMWRILLRNSHIILSVFVLIYVLFYMRLTSWAPWIATAVAIGIGAILRKQMRTNLWGFTIDLLQDTGRVLGELTGMMAPVGMIIGSFVMTGIAFAFPHSVVRMAGGNMYLMLLLGFAASFILGMGVPMVACYVFLAIVLAPGLVAGGINIMAAHLFIMYTAIMSAITPPVALNAFAAATISGGDPMKTGWQACKLGAAKYILAFVFVLNPALILQGPVRDILQVIPTALVGVILVSAGLEGYLWFVGTLTRGMRALMLAAGLLLCFPSFNTDLYGGALFAVLIILVLILKQTKSPFIGLMVKKTSRSP